ncbi:MAG: Abi family protein [Clostridiales bacterium]|nr:Abi family protein [Clostridiales bacterium]
MDNSNYSTPINVEEQIENLKRLHLIIEDEEAAKAVLNRISYYRLIKAYSSSLKNRETGVYKKGTTFNHIYRLYEFDNELRYILFPLFERIEVTLRCRITNHFCTKYGALGYHESTNFGANYDNLYSKICNAIGIASENSPSINHFIRKNGEMGVPLFAVIEVCSFSTLVLFYKTMLPEDKKAIAKMYYQGKYEYLASWFDSIVYVRNICAHFGRLYQRNITKKPMLFHEDAEYKDNNRLYAVLLCMRFICREYGDWRSTVGAIADLIKEYEDVVKMSGLGFSAGWDKRLLNQEPNLLFFD